jgi:lysophospholipase L1-like esterase
MTRRLLILLGMLAVVAVGLGAGYAIGKTSDPGRDESAVHVDEFRAAADAAFNDELTPGVVRGTRAAQGRAGTAGFTDGAEQGWKTGLVAARKAAAAQQSQQAAASPTRLTDASAPADLPGSGGVLVVGDSLEVLTSPYLKQYMPAGTKLTVNAEGGYNSLQIYDLFKEAYDPSQSVIVFDAGTNDNPAYPEILQGRLDAVASEVGDRCMVVPTIHGFVVDGVDNTGKNRVVEQFAASRPGTQTPDWASWVADHQDLMADELHPGAEGADARAQLIAEGVRACLAGAP